MSAARIYVVDDSRTFLDFIKKEIEERFSSCSVRCFESPAEALASLARGDGFDLLLLDWEMDRIDGRKLLDYAKQLGVPFHKVIILSARSAEDLHNEFRQKEVLSVINKADPKQMNALYMILKSLEREKDAGSRDA